MSSHNSMFPTFSNFSAGAFFLNLLWDYWKAENIYGRGIVLSEPLIVDAVKVLVDTWIVEQNHNNSSPYRFVELPRAGLGSPVGYTGRLCTF